MTQAEIVSAEQVTGQQNAEQKAAGGQPQMVIESPTHDAGEVWEGEDIIHTFIIKNKGTAELNLKNVKAG